MHFKVKVGFDLEKDSAAVLDLTQSLNAEETLAADANQAWDLETALRFAREVQTAQLAWLEQPLPAYASHRDWQALAAGENIAGLENFRTVVEQGYLNVIQPDVIKSGGLSGCYDVVHEALKAGAGYCPHFLGGGIRLAASAEFVGRRRRRRLVGSRR